MIGKLDRVDGIDIESQQLQRKCGALISYITVHHMALNGQHTSLRGHGSEETKSTPSRCFLHSQLSARMLSASKFLQFRSTSALNSTLVRPGQLRQTHLFPLITRQDETEIIINTYQKIIKKIHTNLCNNRCYAKSTKPVKPKETITDPVARSKAKLADLEKKIELDIKEVAKQPRAPRITEEDQKAPPEVQRRLASISRATAQVNIKNNNKATKTNY